MSGLKLKEAHYLITGEDEFAIKSRTQSIITKLKPEDELNTETIEAEAHTVDEASDRLETLMESVLTLPFFGGRKLIHFKHCNFLTDSVTGRSEHVKSRLEKLNTLLSETPPASAQVVISAIGIDRRKAFYKKFSKLGEVEFLELPDISSVHGEAAWMDKVEKIMSSRNLIPTDGVVERLVELLGNDTRAMMAEIEKIWLYKHPDREVTEQDLRTIISGNREMMIWDLCDAVTLGKPSEAITILRQLMAQGESDVGILILLGRHIRLAALCMHLHETGRLKVSKRGRFLNATLTSEGEEMLPTNKKGDKPKPFRLAKMIEQLKARSPSSSKASNQWFQAVNIIYETHLKLLSSGTDKKQLLETAVMKLCHT